MLMMMMLKVSSALRLAFGKCSRRIPSRVDARTFPPGEISAFLLLVMNSSTNVVQRWCMFTTRLSLSVKPFSLSRRNTKLKRERERERERRRGEKSWERAGEFCLCRRWCCFVCGMPREGGKRQKRLFFLGMKKKKRILMNFFHFFFSRPEIIQNAHTHTTHRRKRRENGILRRTPFVYYYCYYYY